MWIGSYVEGCEDRLIGEELEDCGWKLGIVGFFVMIVRSC